MIYSKISRFKENTILIKWQTDLLCSSRAVLSPTILTNISVNPSFEECHVSVHSIFPCKAALVAKADITDQNMLAININSKRSTTITL